MRARRSFRSGFRQVRKPIYTNYIETSGLITLAATVDANYGVLLPADSPNKILVTDFASVIAQCENNSRIMKRSFIKMIFVADAPVIASIWVWINTRGMITASTDPYAFSLLPQTEDNAQLRERTLFYKRFIVTPEIGREIHVPLARRRNNYISDASTLTIQIGNNSAVGNLSFSAYGRVRTIEG